MAEKTFGDGWRGSWFRLGPVSGRIFAIFAALVLGGIVWLAGVLGLRGIAGVLLAVAAAVLAFTMLRLVLADAFRQIGQVLEREVTQAVATTAVPPQNLSPALVWPEFEIVATSLRDLVQRQSEHLRTVRQEVAYFRRFAEDIHDLEAFFSESGRLHWVGPAIEQLTGYTADECYAAEDALDLWIYPKDRPVVQEYVERVRMGELVEEIEVRVQRKDQALYWCSCKWYAYYAASGEMTGLRLSMKDIERRKQAELKLLETVAALRRAQALKEHYLYRSDEERMRLSALLDIVNLGILFVGRDRRVVYANQPACDMWGLGDRNGMIGTRDVTLVDMTAAVRADDAAYRAHIAEVVPMRHQSPPYEIHFKDGRVIRELSARVVSSLDDRTTGRIWIYEDVTEVLRARDRLIEMAERDPLTGLLNRRRFHEELTRQLAEANRRGEQIGLLSLDLDGFKAVNDTLGHQAGDEVLISVAHEVGSVIRRNELFFRLGGDEFAILISHATPENTMQLATRIVERAAGLAFRFESGDAHVTLSVGIALSPTHANHPEALTLAADRAMYKAKSQGKNRWAMAEPESADESAGVDAEMD